MEVTLDETTDKNRHKHQKAQMINGGQPDQRRIWVLVMFEVVAPKKVEERRRTQ
jgi:hypothetical protein